MDLNMGHNVVVWYEDGCRVLPNCVVLVRGWYWLDVDQVSGEVAYARGPFESVVEANRNVGAVFKARAEYGPVAGWSQTWFDGYGSERLN